MTTLHSATRGRTRTRCRTAAALLLCAASLFTALAPEVAGAQLPGRGERAAAAADAASVPLPAAAPELEVPVVTPPMPEPPAGIAEEDEGVEDSIVLNFENADIREVIYSLAVAMEINYWVDPRVQGQVTVRTAGRLARADLWPIFHQLLRNNGFAAVKTGDLYSIVPAEEGKTRVVTPGSGLSGEGHFVMNVVKVRHVSAEQMAQTITPFVSPGGDVVSFPRSNLVIVTDIARNAERLADLVGTFDTNTFSEMNAKIFKVEYALLDDLLAELQSILEAYHTTETGSPAVLIPLARLGAIAVIAHDRAVVMAVEYWVSVLDVEAEAGGRRQVYVYRVENSKAVDLAGVLSQVYGEGGGSTSSTRRSRSGEAAEAGLGLGGGLAGSRAGAGGSSTSASTRRSGSNRTGSDDSSGLGSGGSGSGGGLGGST
ncbi:MAG: secretin N-terminal domain-containing protein, partial [Candidatus Binatia bacterium]